MKGQRNGHTIQHKYFLGYKLRAFVKILILREINFADCKHNLARDYRRPFIFAEIIFALCRETVKSVNFVKFIAFEIFALYGRTYKELIRYSLYDFLMYNVSQYMNTLTISIN